MLGIKAEGVVREAVTLAEGHGFMYQDPRPLFCVPVGRYGCWGEWVYAVMLTGGPKNRIFV
jgi:hypothetical protein